MRSSLLVFIVLVGCGRDVPVAEPELMDLPRVFAAPAVKPAVPPAHRVRLEVASNEFDGLRFVDDTVVRTLVGIRCGGLFPSIDGGAVDADAGRTDLSTYSSRFIGVQGHLCVTDGHTESIDDVAAPGAGAVFGKNFYVSGVPMNARGTGFYARTERDGVYRVWVAETGYDATTQRDFIVLDYRPEPNDALCP